MPCKVSHQRKICFMQNDLLQFNEKKNANTFKDFYSNLAEDLVSQLTAAKNIFCMNSVKEYYSALDIPSDSFKFQLTNKEDNLKIISDVDPAKACSLDEIPFRIQKDGAEISAAPISQVVNMSLGSAFPESCNKSKTHIKKIQNQKITDLFHCLCDCNWTRTHNHLVT